jgi:hypothetical protein
VTHLHTHLHEMVFDPAQPLRLQESHVPMRIERDAVQSRDPPRLGLDPVLVPSRATICDGSTLDVDVDSEGCLRLEKVRPSTGAFEAVVDDDDLISQPKRAGLARSQRRDLRVREPRHLAAQSSDGRRKRERTGPLPAP